MAEILFTWMIDRADNLCYRPTILILGMRLALPLNGTFKESFKGGQVPK